MSETPEELLCEHDRRRPSRRGTFRQLPRFELRMMTAGSRFVRTFAGLLRIRVRTRIICHQKGGAEHCDRDLAPWARRRHRATGDAFQVGQRGITVRARTEPRRWHRRGPFCCRHNTLTAGYLLRRLPHRFAEDHRLDTRKAQEVAHFKSCDQSGKPGRPEAGTIVALAYAAGTMSGP